MSPAITPTPTVWDFSFYINEAGVNNRVRALTSPPTIAYTLGNRATLRCQTIDPQQDTETAYRPLVGERIVVLRRSGAFTGTHGRFLIQQAEWYRYLREGDPRLLTFFSGPTIDSYESLMDSIDDELDLIIAAMEWDERDLLMQAYTDAQLWGFTGGPSRFFVQQAELYRYAAEGDERLTVFFMGDTLDVYNALIESIEPSLQDIIEVGMGSGSEEQDAFYAGYLIALQGRPVFDGRILNVTDSPMEEPNRGVQTDIDATSYEEALEHRYLLEDLPGARYGGDPLPVLTVTVGTPARIHAREPDPNLATGDWVILEGVQETSNPAALEGIPLQITIVDPINTIFTVPVDLTAGGAANTYRKVTPFNDVIEDLYTNYLQDYNIGLDLAVISKYGFKGTPRQFLILQAEYYRWVPEGDPRLLTWFSGTTLTDYAATTLGAAIEVFEGMEWDEKAQLVGAANAIMWDARQNFIGSEARWFLQQVEFYRYVEEGDARLQTFLNGGTITAYDALYAADIEPGLAAIIAAMPVDEKAAFDAGYQIATDMVPDVGTEEQFLLQQAEYYRWMVPVGDEPDARLLTWFYAATLTAYDTLMDGAVEDSLADIVAAMAVDEKQALDDGYALAQLEPVGPFKGSISQLLIQQAEFYRYVPEGDPRLLTFFYAPTLEAYAIRMAEIDVELDAIIAAMATDERTAFDTAYYLATSRYAPPFIEKIDFKNVSVMEALRKITAVTNLAFRFMPNRVLELIYLGARRASFIIGPSQAASGLKWSKARPSTGNQVIMSYGGSKLETKDEPITGDGVTRVFPLKYKPVQPSPLASPGHIWDFAADGGVGAWRHVGIFGYDTLFEWVYNPADNTIVQLEDWAGITGWPAPAVGAGYFFREEVQFPQKVVVPDVEPAEPRQLLVADDSTTDYYAAKQTAEAVLTRAMVSARRATVPLAKDSGTDFTIPGAVVGVDIAMRGIYPSDWLISAANMRGEEDGTPRVSKDLIEGLVALRAWQDDLRSLFGGGGGGGGGVISVTGGGGTGGGGVPVPGGGAIPAAGLGLVKPGAAYDVGPGHGIEVTADEVLVKLDGTTLTRSAAGVRLTHDPIEEEMIGAVDDVNKVFTTSAANPRGLLVRLNGLAQQLGTDYLVTAANEITFYFAPRQAIVSPDTPRDVVSASYQRPV